MKKSSILGVALASAGLAAVIGGECFATPTGWAPSSAAIIGSNGSAIDVCLTTGATYNGAPFVVNIKAHSAEDMNYRAQLTFDNFADEQCKTISLPSGGFRFAIDLPAGAGDWAWNVARFNTEGVMEMWVDMDVSSYLSVGNGYSSNIAATTARLKRGEDFNIALKRLAGTEAVSADDDDTNIKSITLVNEAPDSINLETSPKTLVKKIN